jgi:hypothetical protein
MPVLMKNLMSNKVLCGLHADTGKP